MTAAAGQDRLSWQKRLAWSTLPPGARLAGLVISLYAGDPPGQGAWLSVADLGRLTGLSHPTVRRYLRMLTEAGWLHTDRGAMFLDWPGELQFAGEGGHLDPGGPDVTRPAPAPAAAP